MYSPSHRLVIDDRLLAVEELIRQKKFDLARRDLALVKAEQFPADSVELGIYLSLSADCALEIAEYRKAIECGLAAARLLSDQTLHVRYGRTMLTLSRAYSSLGDLKNAEMRAHDSLAAYRRTDDENGQVDALNELARISYIRTNLASAAAYLNDAASMAKTNPRKSALLTGNLGRVRTFTGQWALAEQDLNTALEYNRAHHHDSSVAADLVSLALIGIRKREFASADKRLTEAITIIDRLGLKRDRIIAAEFAGELALERGDFFKAKSILTDAYHQARLLAPNSGLVSQVSRRLAEVELALDHVEEAGKFANIALEVAVELGEKAEIGHARRVLARVFAEKKAFTEAYEHGRIAVDLSREVGDPFDLARALLTLGEIKITGGSDETEKIRAAFDEAGRIYRKLHVEYGVAMAEFRAGVFACQNGDLSRGFRKLSRSEKTFQSLSETSRVKEVQHFLATLSDQAVALSISDSNQFKVFGRLLSQSELRDLKSGQIEEVLQVLVRRTEANRAILYSPQSEERLLVASSVLNAGQIRRFTEGFRKMLGAEISADRPTLRLDCRRDPYVHELFGDQPDVIASVMVVPFKLNDQTDSYLYLDKISVDNLLNPFGQEELNFVVGFSDIVAFKIAEVQKQKLLEDNRRLKAQLQKEAAFPNFITRSTVMMEVLAQVKQVVDSNISISIEGETGCGKDLLARAIHYNSNRKGKRFISVNCAALPETLLESELFGYRKGTFTGADRDKPGLFEEADGGTFFLDEIADMPLNIQAKILRVLEAKEIVRLGESSPRKVDVRIISATNKDLKVQMAAGAFRQDLYYRLSALTFYLPALRQRREDIPLLASHFLEGSEKRLSVGAMKALAAYDWPGNVRELENEIKKSILLAGDRSEIDVDVLSSKVSAQYQPEFTADTPAEPVSGEMLFSRQYSLYDFLATHERQFIIRALKEKGGVKKHAAAALNIPESTLRLKIKQYNIDLDHLDAIN